MGYLVSNSALVSEGGGGGGDVSQSYAEENGGVPVTGTYPVAATGSAKVKVNSSGGAVTITPNGSPETGAHLKVVDVNGSAGTNIITVTGLGTIQTDFGSMEWVYNGSSWDLWEASRELFTRDAATNKITVAEANDTLVADTFENESGSASLDDNGDFVTTGSVTAGSGEIGNTANTKSVAYADFTNAGANINSDGTSHGNVLEYTEETATASIIDDNGWNNTTANLTDNDSGTFTSITTATGYLEFDYGSSKLSSRFSFQQYYDGGGREFTQVEIQTSTDGVSWTTHETLSNASNEIYTNDSDSVVTVDYTPVTTRYVKYIFTKGVSNTTMREFDVFSSAHATTNNTIRAAGDAGVAIVPGSTVLDDEGDTPITASSVVNVRISTNSGSSFGAFEDYSDVFKARTALISPDTGSDFVSLEFQPVGAQRIRSVDLVSQSAKINMGGSGVDFTINGVKVFDVNTGGNIDFTGSATVLTEGANVAVDGSLGPVFTLQVDDENFTIDNPTNIRIGKPYYFFITQDDVAARTITWGTAFKFAGGSAETLTASTDALDMFVFISHDGSTLTHLYSTKNIS